MRKAAILAYDLSCLFTVAAAAVVLVGCGESVQNESVEATGSTLCFADYADCVNPIFDAAITGRTGSTTCSSAGCHSIQSGSGGAFKIYSGALPEEEEMSANFFSAKAFANLDSPSDSKILLEPLQGSASVTGTHTGGDIFPSTTDVCYVAIHDWISNRVDDEFSEQCGQCVAPDLTSCGY